MARLDPFARLHTNQLRAHLARKEDSGDLHVYGTGDSEDGQMVSLTRQQVEGLARYLKHTAFQSVFLLVGEETYVMMEEKGGGRRVWLLSDFGR